MKLPSINFILSNAKYSLLRFPLTILSSFIAVILAIYLIEIGKNIDEELPYINVMLCMSIGIPLYFCATIISNKKGFDKKRNLIINLLATLILVLLYFTFPDSKSAHSNAMPYIKYALYNITCHLLVSFIPFAFSKQLNAFWHYNKILFIRIWASILYSGFIYVGLIIALSSLRLLFDIHIHEKLYLEIWVVVICFFNTWFFVSGIPADFDQLDDIHEYPKGLKTFSQYVLLPLLGLYLIILYAYGTKILILWDWPRGIVTYLIICVSVLGILAFLLLYPYGNQKENIWIKKASKGYYFLLFPLLIILFIAIFMRVNDYGITINRYIILMLGIWLTIVCLYTAIGKINIKFIPTSLAVMLILISFGPWGMFSFSEKSQVNRLKNILEQSKILVNNKIQNEAKWDEESLINLSSKNDRLLEDSLHNEVRSIFRYLEDYHGFSLVREWYKQDIDSIIDLKNVAGKVLYKFSDAEMYMRAMGLSYDYITPKNNKTKLEYYTKIENSIKKVTGFDYVVSFNNYNYNNEDINIDNFEVDSTKFHLNYSNKGKGQLSLFGKNDTIYFGLNELINNLKKEYGNDPEKGLPISKMQLLGSSKKFDVKIEFQSLDIEVEKKGLNITNISGDIFIKQK